jgi:hypothetical protein
LATAESAIEISSCGQSRLKDGIVGVCVGRSKCVGLQNSGFFKTSKNSKKCHLKIEKTNQPIRQFRARAWF